MHPLATWAHLSFASPLSLRTESIFTCFVVGVAQRMLFVRDFRSLDLHRQREKRKYSNSMTFRQPRLPYSVLLLLILVVWWRSFPWPLSTPPRRICSRDVEQSTEQSCHAREQTRSHFSPEECRRDRPCWSCSVKRRAPARVWRSSRVLAEQPNEVEWTTAENRRRE